MDYLGDGKVILLRNAEIIKNLKFGELFEIPEIESDYSGDSEIPDEIDIVSYYEKHTETNPEDNKEEIYKTI